jgi:hypothetical protein
MANQFHEPILFPKNINQYMTPLALRSGKLETPGNTVTKQPFGRNPNCHSEGILWFYKAPQLTNHKILPE